MRNTVTLDQPEELAALFGDGFTLRLANGQEITIKAEGELIKMDGKFTFFLLDVRGPQEVVRDAIKQAADFITDRLTGSPAKEVNGTAAAPPALTDRTFVADPDGDARKPSPSGRGKGEGKRKPRAAKREAKTLWCPANCGKGFLTEGRRKNHAKKAHGIEL